MNPPPPRAPRWVSGVSHSSPSAAKARNAKQEDALSVHVTWDTSLLPSSARKVHTAFEVNVDDS